MLHDGSGAIKLPLDHELRKHSLDLIHWDTCFACHGCKTIIITDCEDVLFLIQADVECVDLVVLGIGYVHGVGWVGCWVSV